MLENDFNYLIRTNADHADNHFLFPPISNFVSIYKPSGRATFKRYSHLGTAAMLHGSCAFTNNNSHSNYNAVDRMAESIHSKNGTYSFWDDKTYLHWHNHIDFYVPVFNSRFLYHEKSKHKNH